jgi:thioredoxin 1
VLSTIDLLADKKSLSCYMCICPAGTIAAMHLVSTVLTMASFQELIQTDKPVLVDFYADWCGPCKMMAPILKEAKAQLGERVTIVKVDIDRNRQAAEYYGIQSVPTLLLFQKGEVKWRQSGVVPAAALTQVVQRYATEAQ